MPVGLGPVSGWAAGPVRQWAALKSCANPNEHGKVANGFEPVLGSSLCHCSSGGQAKVLERMLQHYAVLEEIAAEKTAPSSLGERRGGLLRFVP